MIKEEVYEKLNAVFRDVFDDETISISENMTANDIEGWDSLVNITLIECIEEEFGIKFSMREILAVRNIGEMVSLILKLKA